MGPGGVDNGPPGVGGPPGSGTPGPSLNGEPLPGGGTMEMKRSPGTAPTTPSQTEFFGGGGENVSFFLTDSCHTSVLKLNQDKIKRPNRTNTE